MNGNFIPFGAQYYRAPTPLSGDWDRDLKAFKDYGFNTVKIWAQWRWNCPREGVYDFADLDRIMQIAFQNGLKVIINVIFDAAPSWFYRKYQDSVMITSDGRRVEPQDVPYRQAGGAPGPCYNHTEGIRLRGEFLERVAARYKDHPALSVWDLWNEPELTCGIYRKPVQADMVCYCGRCVRGFRTWLQRKYETVEELNRRWNRNYGDWEEVEVPRNGGTFNDMIDWRTYFAHVLTEELRWRVEAVKRIDSRTPVMVHTVPMPHFNMVNACSNDYELAQLCDIFGNSVGSDPFPAALAMTCAQGKPVINAEIHALGGDTYGRPIIPSFDEMKNHVLTPLSKGVKGFVFWQYRPERLGRESPAWGLTSLDGGPTPWLYDCARINRVLQQHAAVISSVKPLTARIAVLNSNKNQIFDWCVRGNVDLHSNSVIGAFMALHDGNLDADIVGLEQLSEELLRGYQVIYYPFPYYLDAKTAALLKAWVEDGGSLISEAFFGALSEEDGLHSTVVPGFGFTEVFGVKEGDAVSAAMFNNAYDKMWYSEAENQFIPVALAERVASLPSVETIEGYYFAEELLVQGSAAEILGRFANGKVAVTANAYGRGKAIMIGTLLGYAYHRKEEQGVRDFICELVKSAGFKSPVSVEGGGGKVHADVLINDRNEAILIVSSKHHEAVDVEISLASDLGIESLVLTDLFAGTIWPIQKTEAGLRIELKLSARGHELYSL